MILKEEQLVNSILLKSAELDKEANCAGKRPFYDQVLLASNLLGRQRWFRGCRAVLTASRSCSRSLRALSVIC